MERELFGNHPDDEQYQADGYCGISAVKGRPVVVVPMEVDKVNDLSPSDSVYEVSYGPAKDQGKGNGGIEAPRPETAQEIKNEGYCNKGSKDKQHGLGSAYLPGK